MKFCIKSVPGVGRLGLITNVARLPDFKMETPHILLYTQGATVPYLSYDVLNRVTAERLCLNIPVQNVDILQDRLKLSNFKISEFIGMKEYLSYCTFINPGEKRIPGFHEKNKFSLWSRRGRKTYSAESYMEFIKDSKPDMFLVLADGDTDSCSSKKRISNSSARSISFFEKCQEIYNGAEHLKESQMIGALEGGFDETLRQNFSKIIGESSVFGVVVDGLHDCSEAVAEIKFKDIKPMIEISLKHIPHDKLRIIHGAWNPSVLLDLVELGIDLFDSSYPFYISEQAGALIFPNNNDIFDHINQNEVAQVNLLNGDESAIEKIEGPPSKRIKLLTKSKYHISLMDSNFATDFTPILKNCECYTCKHHTKAYIHHLLEVEELLGPTLLMMHNLHHYLQFLSTIRESIKAGNFQDLKQCFVNWIKKNR